MSVANEESSREAATLSAELCNLPYGFEKWNRALRGAYLKGKRAFLTGQKIHDCPYADHRKPSGKLSWSRSFIRAWQDGLRDAELHNAEWRGATPLHRGASLHTTG